MNTWLKLWRIPVIGSLALATALGAPSPRPEVAAAIQAIQQAPDPSAAVAAYANGVALDRDDPKLSEAYVARMVDLGLPELAYHQAQALTSRESNSGLAWGVVAYVDARRGQMPDAIAAINLAGQLVPNHPFVERTAGEILAWYDAKADKSKLPQNEKDGLTRVRSLMRDRPAFIAAYDTAKKAYESQASVAEPTGAAAPSPVPGGQAPVADQPQGEQVAPLGYAGSVAPVPPPPAYYYPQYSDAYYDWGPGWVAPAPWWWWQPTGFFGGFSFFSFGAVVVFDDDDHHGSHHHHDGQSFHHGHDGSFTGHGQNGQFSHANNSMVWHHDANGRTSFFGQPARADGSLVQWTRQSFHTAPSSMSGRTSTGWALPPSASVRSGRPAVSSPSFGQAPSSARGNGMAAPSFHSRSAPGAGGWSGMASPPARSWSGSPAGGWAGAAPPSSWSGRSFQSAPSMAAPHMGAPMGGGSSPGGAVHGGGAGGGGVHGGGGFSGGGSGGGGGHR